MATNYRTQPRVEGDRAADERLRAVEQTIDEVAGELWARQDADGFWQFELEADATIPAEYILLEHYLDIIDPGIQQKLANYLRRRQGEHGGWPLFHDGAFDLSASVKAYYALKLAGDHPDAPHMRAARDAILAHGGAARCNVFTRICLALFGQVPWRAVPVMPIELILLPRWFPFHLDKVSYWSRTVLVPLLILMALKPRARNPRGVNIVELFVTPPENERHFIHNPTGTVIGQVFLGVDRVLRLIEPLIPRSVRRRAIGRALDFIGPRLNGVDGLGGIFPAMANVLFAFEALGVGRETTEWRTALAAVRRLLVVRADEGYCQPCFSPVWDSVLSLCALIEADGSGSPPPTQLRHAAEWLIKTQVSEPNGDWRRQRPDLQPGGWPFQFRNDHYPDLDDTAVVVMALDRVRDCIRHPSIDQTIEQAVVWVRGMQSSDGGWGAFDADNTHHYLNHIPFADHGALLDPPTADVTARCVTMFCQLGFGADDPVVARGMEWLRRAQEPDGSWFGRWGTNYIYGTWSVLSAYRAAGVDMSSEPTRRAVAWLQQQQRADGGWGEDGFSYWPDRRGPAKVSTATQTAWALLALMHAGEVGSEAVRRGIDYLLAAPRLGAKWEERAYNAVGFPRVFYLLYHGYSMYFPLLALARYRNAMTGVSVGQRTGL